MDTFKELCNLAIHACNAFDSDIPIYGDEGWNDECAKAYAYVKYAIDCLNDVPASRIEYAIEKGLKLPEVEI